MHYCALYKKFEVTASPNDELANFMEVFKTTADKVIGTIPRSRNREFSSVSHFEALVDDPEA